MTSDPLYYWQHRYLFASQDAFQNISKGIWAYKPDRQISSLATYGFPGKLSKLPFLNHHIEYNCKYKTNNLGFVQKRNIKPEDNSVLILGDSFTEGQGGCPWFPELENNFSTPLINGGLQGYGLLQWELLTRHLLSKDFNFEKIVIIAISNDFKRRTHNWSSHQLDCMNNYNCSGSEYWLPLLNNESEDSIIERSIDRSNIRFKNHSRFARLHEALMHISYSYKFVALAYSSFDSKNSSPISLNSDANNAIKFLKRTDNKLSVILVPQRDEAALSAKNHDSLETEKLLKNHSIPFSWCSITSHDYLPMDGHPNRQGYNKIRLCVTEHLQKQRNVK
jgi:hypothetical protein